MSKHKNAVALWEEYSGRFGLEGERNLLNDAHLGIVNGHLTTNTPHSEVLTFRSLYAPPYASSNFVLEGKVCGEIIRSQSNSWLPFQITRRGHVAGIDVVSVVTLVEGERALILEVRLTNTGEDTRTAPLQFDILGGLDYATSWDFAKPIGEKGTRLEEKGDVRLRLNDTGAIALGARDMTTENYVPFWSTALVLEGGQTRNFWLTLAIGDTIEAEALVRHLLEDPAAAVRETELAWAVRADQLLGRLPRFKAADARLEKFYDRSALHLLLNQWRVPEFLLQPYYSTGSINGGCVCSYLWDFGSGWELFPIVDPAALREHVKTFLSIDLTRHFAFNPISGAGWGPWYYINQEKITFLIYHYVLITGDTAFLHEKVRDKTIIEWVLYQALYGDKLEPKANLIDYGDGNHHLELRRSYRYDNFLPDMNLRRHPIYLAAEVLCGIAKVRPPVNLSDRAAKLKKLVRKQMWSDEHKWWFFLDPAGNKHLRFTMQLFKLIGSKAITSAEERDLVEHLNDEEFLSEYGLHSMSKLDPAYDQIDIDNGGGGACSCFTPQIIERLYKGGYTEKAGELLRRILWWGDRLPYWSDSLVANAIDYRKDTPLQNAIGSVCGAQSIIFGMFGVKVDPDGNVTVNPAPPPYSPQISLEGLNVRGMSLSITIDCNSFEVRQGKQTFTSKIGRPVVVPAIKK
jgi:hypothetical protein